MTRAVPAWIRLLVSLHPRAFRERFGAEIEDAATRSLGDRSRPRIHTVWFLTSDLVGSVIREQAARLREPRYSPAEVLPDPGLRPLTTGERMNTLLQDIRHAARSLVRVPGFSLTVIVSLALGIGANALVYSLVDGLMVRPFPYPDADRLVAVGPRYAEDRERRFIESVAPAEFEEIRTTSRTLERFFAFDLGNRNLSGGDYPERVFTAFIWGDPFSTIGLRPWLGRGFTDQETRTDGSLAILSHRVWQSRFGSDSSLVGRTIEVNGVPRTVVGVMPPELILYATDLWLPMGVAPDVIPRRVRNWAVVGRMREGTSMTAVQTDLATIASAIARNWEGQHPEYRQWSLGAAPWAEVVSAMVRPAGLVMIGAVAFVLLLATANIASLMLARATVRQREMAVRSALGARTPRLARQLLTEAMLLSLAGGGAGVALAYFLIGPSMSLFPPFASGLGMTPAINGNVLIVTLVATVLVGLFTSLAPVAQVARRRGSLGLAATGRQFASRSTRRVRQVFTVAQVALAVMLLSGATVMLRSMDQLARVDTGIDEDRILTMRLSLNLDKYERDEVAPFFEGVTEKLAAIPGVVSASAATQFPPANGFRAAMVTEEPRQAGAASTTVDVTNATGKHAETLGLRLLSGRHFMAADGAESPRVVQLNATAAQRFFGDASPLGSRVGLVAGEDTVWHEVVGVVSDARNRGLDAPVMPEVFVPVRQQQVAWNNQLYLLVRASGNPAALMPSVREVLRSVDPTQPVYMVRTMEAAFAESLSIRRAASWLLVSFAVIALVLAAVGLYGILSYLVSARTHEIGVRMALGANERSVVGLVMRETAWLVGIGAAIGLGGVMAVRGVISAIAFEAGAADPVTLAVSLALLTGTALLAGFAPTRRAVRVDPLESLRNNG